MWKNYLYLVWRVAAGLISCGTERLPTENYLWFCFCFQAPESYKNVTDVVNTCHDAGISKKAIKLRPIAVIKGWSCTTSYLKTIYPKGRMSCDKNTRDSFKADDFGKLWSKFMLKKLSREEKKLEFLTFRLCSGQICDPNKGGHLQTWILYEIFLHSTGEKLFAGSGCKCARVLIYIHALVFSFFLKSGHYICTMCLADEQ